MSMVYFIFSEFIIRLMFMYSWNKRIRHKMKNAQPKRSQARLIKQSLFISVRKGCRQCTVSYLNSVSLTDLTTRLQRKVTQYLTYKDHTGVLWPGVTYLLELCVTVWNSPEGKNSRYYLIFTQACNRDSRSDI